MTDRELMQQELDALESRGASRELHHHVITALRERLAQPEQEPIAWRFRFPNGTKWHYTEYGPNEYTRPELTWEPLSLLLRERLSHCDRCGKKLGGPGDIHTCSPQQPVFHLRSHGDVSADEMERLAQPVQEPFCYHDGRNIVGKEYADHSDVFPLYTAPQPRQWQGLTDEEMRQLQDANWTECEGGGYDWNTFAFARSIEAKLEEKNT